MDCARCRASGRRRTSRSVAQRGFTRSGAEARRNACGDQGVRLLEAAERRNADLTGSDGRCRIAPCRRSDLSTGTSKTLTSWMERISAPVQVSRPGDESTRPFPHDRRSRSAFRRRAPAIKGSESLPTLGSKGVFNDPDPLNRQSSSPRLRAPPRETPPRTGSSASAFGAKQPARSRRRRTYSPFLSLTISATSRCRGSSDAASP